MRGCEGGPGGDVSGSNAKAAAGSEASAAASCCDGDGGVASNDVVAHAAEAAQKARAAFQDRHCGLTLESVLRISTQDPDGVRENGDHAAGTREALSELCRDCVERLLRAYL